MTGFDDNMLYFRELCSKDGVKKWDKIIALSNVNYIEYDDDNNRLVINFKTHSIEYYHNLRNGETMLDYYHKCLIPLPELDTKKKRNRRRVAD
jgi:hypothetical protein